MLNMPIKEIKELISLREEYWEYIFETNCYAFALGFDIPENDICKNAFQPGVIAANGLNIPLSEIAKLKFEDRNICIVERKSINYYNKIKKICINEINKKLKIIIKININYQK